MTNAVINNHSNNVTVKTKKQPNLNNSFNILNTNLEGLHTINTNTPEWNITPGNTHPERVPLSLQYKPNVPKLRLPAFLQAKGGKRRTKRTTKRVTKRATKRVTKRIKRKN